MKNFCTRSLQSSAELYWILEPLRQSPLRQIRTKVNFSITEMSPTASSINIREKKLRNFKSIIKPLETNPTEFAKVTELAGFIASILVFHFHHLSNYPLDFL